MVDRMSGTQTIEVVNALPPEVHLIGDLDLANRDSMTSICLGYNEPVLIVDMSGLTFMDCSGYGALVAARATLEQRGQTMNLVGATGQPPRPMQPIADLG